MKLCLIRTERKKMVQWTILAKGPAGAQAIETNSRNTPSL